MQSLAMKVLVETSKELVVEFGTVRRTATPFIGASIPLVAALVTRTAYPEGSPSLAWGAGLSGLLLSRWAMQRIGTTVQWRFTSKFGCFQKFVRPYFSSDYAEDNGGGARCSWSTSTWRRRLDRERSSSPLAAPPFPSTRPARSGRYDARERTHARDMSATGRFEEGRGRGGSPAGRGVQR